jgi:type III secretion protein C
VDLQLGRGNGAPLSFDPQAGGSGAGGLGDVVGTDGQPLSLPGALLNVAIGHDARNYLLARVHALAQRGNANFVARPKVLTLDNIEAVLENQTEFHVRVNGFQDAGLFSVTAGTAVRVTPKVVDDGAPGVMMSIHIDDGDLSAVAVDQIPVVRRRAIQTQALVEEGQSLLIAGYTSEEKSNATTGVPLLSDLPLIGRAFRFEEKKQVSMERFYLLTPRLVSARGTAPTATPAQPSNQ